MTSVSPLGILASRDKFARRGGSGSRAFEHDDAYQKKQRAGRDDADNKDGKARKHDLPNFFFHLHYHLHTHMQLPHLQPRPALVAKTKDAPPRQVHAMSILTPSQFHAINAKGL
ncbi:hypothetical protein IG631_00117 [Alternaria alternata]|nr:hypothetical protein IG631_00117 [Alternaria alternata]